MRRGSTTSSPVSAIARIAGALLWANPGRLIVLVAGAVSVALAASGIVLAASTSVAIVSQTVDAGWRGTYDLLVRPADAPSLSAGGHQLVPLDYLGLRTSGITRQQWEQIAQLPNVAIAAPVAALGWVKNSSPGVGVELASVQPGLVYEVQVRGKIADQDAVRLDGLITFTSDRDEVDVGFRDYSGPDPVTLGLGDLPATWGLVVGIDPAAEDALIGLSSFTHGRYLTTGTSEVFDQNFRRNAIAVPVLTAARSPIPGDLAVTVSTLNGVTPDQVRDLFNASGGMSGDQLQAAIEGLVAKGSLNHLSGDEAPLRDLLRPLVSSGILFGSDGQLVSTSENRGGGTAADDDLVLVPSLAGYRPGNDQTADLALAGQGAWQDIIGPQLAAARPPGWIPPEATFGGDATVYRHLDVTVPPAFVVTPIGTYDREAIDEQFAGAANYAPLGIYAAIPRTLVADGSGRAVDQPLPVSINPAGLNPQPPIGLTNIEAAEALRGNHFIDAIRVRVSGITGYSPDAVRRLESVAQQIVETTGLHVDVIAGSSPVDLRVAIPGVGIMSERWTTLGAAAQILTGAQGLSAGLLAAALGVVLAYLAAFGVFLAGDQAVEFSILRRVGWRRRAVVALAATQAVAVGLIAASMTVGLVIVLAAAAGRHIDGWALAAAALAVLAAHPAAAGLASFAPFGRPGAPLARRASRSASTRGGLLALAMALAAEAPGRAVTAGVATALALALAGIIAVIEVAAGGELRATLFGAAVAVRIESYHLLAAAAALFGAGALILDGALLTVERRLALIGTLRAVGWRSSAIRRLVTLEAGLPALIAGLVAAVVVSAAALALGLGAVSALLALGVFTLAVLLAAVATELPARVAVQTAPAATLRAEGASGVIGGFAPRQALLTVIALIVTVGLVAVGWSAAERAASKPLPFVQPTEHPLSPVAARIQADVTSLAAHPDRTPGSSTFEQALVYMTGTLTDSGYKVETHAYLSPQVAFLDSGGRAVDPPGVFSASIAYDAAAWDGRNLDLPATLVDATDNQLPATCPAGIGVLRIADYTGVSLAHEMQKRCLRHTAAVVAFRATSDVWAVLSAQVVRVHLPVARYITALSPKAASKPNAPWLVAAVDSRGPGASQSAAPDAVMLAVARQASADGLALRIGIVSSMDNAGGSVFLEELTAWPTGPVLWLGPMGGSVAPVLGTTTRSGFDRAAATAGLLWIAPVDAAFADWLARATAPSDDPTSTDLLDVLSGATGIVAGADVDLNDGPLSAGLDAAWLGEPAAPVVGPPSIAGTAADRADQIHPRDLEQLTTSILAALGKLHQ